MLLEEVKKKKKNEEEEGNSYICTCCHDVRYTRKRMVQFVEEEYNFDHDIVSKVLCEKYRCKGSDGSEFICDTCHSHLAKIDPVLPKKCAYNMEIIGKISISKVKEQNEEDHRRHLIERAGEKFKEMANKFQILSAPLAIICYLRRVQKCLIEISIGLMVYVVEH